MNGAGMRHSTCSVAADVRDERVVVVARRRHRPAEVDELLIEIGRVVRVCTHAGDGRRGHEATSSPNGRSMLATMRRERRREPLAKRRDTASSSLADVTRRACACTASSVPNNHSDGGRSTSSAHRIACRSATGTVGTNVPVTGCACTASGDCHSYDPVTVASNPPNGDVARLDADGAHEIRIGVVARRIPAPRDCSPPSTARRRRRRRGSRATRTRESTTRRRARRRAPRRPSPACRRCRSAPERWRRPRRRTASTARRRTPSPSTRSKRAKSEMLRAESVARCGARQRLRAHELRAPRPARAACRARRPRARRAAASRARGPSICSACSSAGGACTISGPVKDLRRRSTC